MMVRVLAEVAIFLAAFIGMEGFAWVTHRFVMHGFMWCWHESHHAKREGVFELNDLFAVVFAAPAILFIWLGVNVSIWFLPLGLGVTAYGAVYFFFHDGLVHRRFPIPIDERNGFWRPRIQAHRIHHAVSSKTGCVSYGFLMVRPVRELKAQLRALQREQPPQPHEDSRVASPRG
jgi:beta-carotene 3-hydroxylase